MARSIRGRIPFSYRGGATLPHRVPANLKLLSLLVLSVTAFSSIPGLLLSAMFTGLASLSARIRPWELLRGSRSLLILSLFILVFKTVYPGAPGVSLGGIIVFNLSLPAINIPFISAQGFFEGILLGLRVMVSFAAGSLLFAVTTMRELRLSLGKAERAALSLFAAVRRSGPAVCRLSLGISLMLGFIPRFFELWETVNLACDARSCRRGLRRLALIIPLIIERMMEMAADTAEALEVRGLQ